METETSASVWSMPIESESSAGDTLSSTTKEHVEAGLVHKQLKVATESLQKTLAYSSNTHELLTSLELQLAENLNNQYNLIEESRQKLEAKIAKLGTNVDIPIKVVEGLKGRYKIIKRKLTTRQTILRMLLASANHYIKQSSIPDLCDLTGEVYYRLSVLNDELNDGGNVRQILYSLKSSIKQVKSLPCLTRQDKNRHDPIGTAFESMERENVFNDAMKQIQHFIEVFDKSSDEAAVEVTESCTGARLEHIFGVEAPPANDLARQST